MPDGAVLARAAHDRARKIECRPGYRHGRCGDGRRADAFPSGRARGHRAGRDSGGCPLAPIRLVVSVLRELTTSHESLGDAVDMILDGGPSRHGLESTIVSLSPVAAILRPGRDFGRRYRLGRRPGNADPGAW